MPDRFWRGGTANWDGTAGTKWAATVGGAGGASVPTSADDVFFDATSGAVTCTISTGNTGARSINCTGFTGTLTGIVLITVSGSVTLVASMTYSYTGTLQISGTGTITSAGKTFANVLINGVGITVTLADNLTIRNISVLQLNQGTINLSNNTVSAGVFTSSTAGVRSIAFGSGNIELTSTANNQQIISMADARNFTWTGTGGFRRNMSPNNSNVQFGQTLGGSASNAPNLTITGGGNTLQISPGSWFRNIDFTGSTTTVTSISTAMFVTGNLTLATGGTYTLLAPTFRASGTLTSSGRSLGAVGINAAGGTVTLADALTTDAFSITAGTFNAAGFNVTSPVINLVPAGASTRTVNMASGTWTCTGSTTTAWNASPTTNLTLSPGTSTISMTGASAKTFVGGGLTYYNLNQGGAGALTISGSNTFNNITNTTQPATVTFTAGTTQTVSNFGLSGTAGNLITINSSTAGSQFTLSDPSGTVFVQNVSIQDSNATGGATWLAPTNRGNVNVSNNTGWIFTPISATGNMLMMFA
jgi:hypothetical protein